MTELIIKRPAGKEMIGVLQPEQLRVVPSSERLVPEGGVIVNIEDEIKRGAITPYPGYPDPKERIHMTQNEIGLWSRNGRKSSDLVTTYPTANVTAHSNRIVGLDNGKAMSDDGIQDFGSTTFPDTFFPEGYERDERGLPVRPHDDIFLQYGAVEGLGFYWFPGPNKAADPVPLRIRDGQLQVLGIERFDTGTRALAGGMVDKEEPAVSAALRELFEEAGIEFRNGDVSATVVHQGIVWADPRATRHAWPESTVAMILVPDTNKTDDIHLKAGDDARKAGWYPVSKAELTKFSFSHPRFILHAVEEFERQTGLVVANDGSIGIPETNGKNADKKLPRVTPGHPKLISAEFGPDFSNRVLNEGVESASTGYDLHLIDREFVKPVLLIAGTDEKEPDDSKIYTSLPEKDIETAVKLSKESAGPYSRVVVMSMGAKLASGGKEYFDKMTPYFEKMTTDGAVFVLGSTDSNIAAPVVDGIASAGGTIIGVVPTAPVVIPNYARVNADYEYPSSVLPVDLTIAVQNSGDFDGAESPAFVQVSEGLAEGVEMDIIMVNGGPIALINEMSVLVELESRKPEIRSRVILMRDAGRGSQLLSIMVANGYNSVEELQLNPEVIGDATLSKELTKETIRHGLEKTSQALEKYKNAGGKILLVDIDELKDI